MVLTRAALFQGISAPGRRPPRGRSRVNDGAPGRSIRWNLIPWFGFAGKR